MSAFDAEDWMLTNRIAGNGFIRKMTKQTILNTQIEKLVESLQDPPVPLALRAISTLVLGIAYDLA